MVRGLTTAASLWAVAAIGLAVGSGLFVAALASTVIVLVVLAGIKPIEEYYRRRVQTRALTLLVKRGEFTFDQLKQTAGAYSHRIHQFVLQHTETENLDEVDIVFARVPQPSFLDIVATLPSVEKVETPDLIGTVERASELPIGLPCVKAVFKLDSRLVRGT